MRDLGEFTPKSAIGPVAELDETGKGTGRTKLGRVTTSEEQRAEALQHALVTLAGHRENAGTLTVIWSRGEPTVLQVSATVEHVEGEPVYVLDRVMERTLSGAELQRNLRHASDQLLREIAEISEAGSL